MSYLSTSPQDCYAVQATFEPSGSSLGSCKEGSSSAPGGLTLPHTQPPIYPCLPQFTPVYFSLLNVSNQQRTQSSVYPLSQHVIYTDTGYWLVIDLDLVSTLSVTVC